ncbi:hypothetical protein GCM10010310_52700 [Streptomyces violaceolatus]|uniref:Uncharacterized protein n=1 Tax=Streptomyces violaceolatus TaxID=67378 RepID=A0ABN3T491_9ACTN|nr:hypothetical protein JCM4020_57370 [Streptomyces coelicolor]
MPTMPSPTARTPAFVVMPFLVVPLLVMPLLVMLTEFLLGDQEKTRPRPEPLARVPGRAQQLEW